MLKHENGLKWKQENFKIILISSLNPSGTEILGNERQTDENINWTVYIEWFFYRGLFRYFIASAS